MLSHTNTISLRATLLAAAVVPFVLACNACSTSADPRVDTRDRSTMPSLDAGPPHDAAAADASTASDTGSSSSDAADTPSNVASGTVGGKPFTIKSGIARQDSDGIALVLSDMDGLCASTSAGKIHPGETLIQLYGLEGTAPGTFTSTHDDIKYATVDSSCASESLITIAKAGRAQSSTITIAVLSASRVAGTLDIAFDDGSTVSGAFDVPTCGSELHAGLLCH